VIQIVARSARDGGGERRTGSELGYSGKGPAHDAYVRGYSALVHEIRDSKNGCDWACRAFCATGPSAFGFQFVHKQIVRLPSKFEA
jgi:hypothetical protein